MSDCFFIKFNQNGNPFSFEGVGCNSTTGMCPYNSMMSYLITNSYKSLGFDAKTAKNNCHQRVLKKLPITVNKVFNKAKTNGSPPDFDQTVSHV